MRKLYKLNIENNLHFSSCITKFITPDYVYIPIDKGYNILVKTNDKVIKSQSVLEKNLYKILSPVSGIILGTKKMNVNNVMQNCLVIQNDFTEKTKVKERKKTLKYGKDELICKLYEFYFKDIAKELETKKINNLVINGIEDEPYIMNKIYILNKYPKEILTIADILSTTFEISNTYLAVKSDDSSNVETYLNLLGTYPNITLSLIEDKYLLGKEFFLKEYLNVKDEDTLVIDIRLLLEIYNALVLSKYSHETFVTVGGLNSSKNGIYYVKKGTTFKNLLVSNNIKIKDNSLCILNGLMMGKICDIENSIITFDTLGLMIIPDKKEKELPCKNCGLCFKICPVKVNPKRIMDEGLTTKNCLNCGLCSYICPSYINLRKYLEGKNE